MRRNTKKIVAGVAAIAALAAGGAAFTASNTVADSVAGYGTSTISGANATSIKYTLSADGTQINSAALVFHGNVSTRTIAAGFGSDALTDCTVGSYDSGTDSTPATCSGYTQDTAASATFNVAVS